MTDRTAFKKFTPWLDQHRALLVGVTLLLASFAFVSLLDWDALFYVDAANPAFAEALALREGHLDIPLRLLDTAVVDGKIYNIFQPGLTLFFWLHLLFEGMTGLAWFKLEIFLLFALSAGLLGYAFTRLSGGRWLLALALTVSLMFGAPYIGNLPAAMNGFISRIGHVMAIACVAAMLAVISRSANTRTLFLTGLCIGAAMLFRMQNLFLLIIPVGMLLHDETGERWRIKPLFADATARRELLRKLLALLIVPLLAGLLIATVQYLKFGSPFDNGYALIHEGREIHISNQVRKYGLFHVRFLWRNIKQTLFSWPEFHVADGRLVDVVGDKNGNSLLVSTPVLLLFFLYISTLKQARVQVFLLAVLALTAPVLLYVNPGCCSPGYMRMALDYGVLWGALLAVMARYAETRRWRVGLAIAAAVWSVWYGWAVLHFIAEVW